MKWISVKDRLPSYGLKVLIVTNRGTINIANYSGQWNDWNVKNSSNITHWMPLPEPPKEVNT